MNTSLHMLFLIVFVFGSTLISAQSSIVDTHSHTKSEVCHSNHEASRVLNEYSLFKLKDFSHNTISDHIHSDHDHSGEVSLLDIISSDEGTDFNCSGGFCMNKSHFHKKGLTIKKQLFVYFMKMSC